MTDQLQRTECWDTASSVHQTGQNLVQECYRDNSALSTRESDNSNTNLPSIEFHVGDEPLIATNECSTAATTGSDLPPVAKLVSKLGDEDFSEREKATEELRKLGPVAMPDLLKATKDDDPEIAARAKGLVEKIVGKSIQRQLKDIQFELMFGTLPGKDAQERSKDLQKEYDKYNNDPRQKEQRLRDLEQLQKQVGKDLTPAQNKRIEDQLHDLKNMNEVKWRLHDISEFADLRAEEEEEARLGKFVEQLELGLPPRPILPGDIEPPPPSEVPFETWDIRGSLRHPVQLEDLHGVLKNEQ